MKKKIIKIKLRSADAVDIYIGQELKKRRRNLGITQHGLAKVVGVTFQQIQKYEKGVNRISIGNFYKIIKFLELDANQLFSLFERQSAMESKKVYDFVFTIDEDNINQKPALAA